MTDPATVALQSLAFSSLGRERLAHLIDRVIPDDAPVQFRPYEPAEAFDVIARSTTTPRLVKLAALQHWRTSGLHELVPPDHEAIQVLAAAVVTPEMLHGGTPPGSPAGLVPDVEPLFELLDEYGATVDDLDPPEEDDAAAAYAVASYAAATDFFEATKAFIEYELWEQPPPSCAVWLKNGAICFSVYFEVHGVTVDEMKPLTDPMMWPSCGGGFWISMKRVDTSRLYQEQARLMPGWVEWVTLDTDRKDTAGVEYCLLYELASAPELAVNEGYLCVSDNGRGGVAVAMRKCLRWQDALIQRDLIDSRSTICILMLSHLQGMANSCRIDTATAIGVVP